MKSTGGLARILAGFLNTGAGGGVFSSDAFMGAIATAAVGLAVKSGRALFRESADARAHRVIQESLRGEFALFEVRLMDQLGKEFVRAAVFESRFASFEASRLETVNDLRALRAELGRVRCPGVTDAGRCPGLKDAA